MTTTLALPRFLRSVYMYMRPSCVDDVFACSIFFFERRRGWGHLPADWSLNMYMYTKHTHTA